MTGLVVTGYASLDYPVGLSGQIGGDRTTLIDHRDPAAWPRIGGCPAYMALAVAQQGGSVSPVTWIGSGAESDHYVETLRDAEAGIGGIARLPSARTPTAILAYQADGTCACLFDPVFAGEEKLTQAQRDLLAGADHLCISVGPPHLNREILACRKASARLYWVIKNDPNCFFPEICREISSVADVIFCNEAERSLVAETPREAVIVETRGAHGIAVEREGQVRTLTVDPLTVRDTTGAGDTLAGGFIAARMAGTTDAVAATQAGLDAARKLLKQRQERQTP